MKRAGDLIAAAVLLALLALPMAILALALRLREGPGVLFRQTRMGRQAVPFTILKFRTMRHAQAGEAEITAGDQDARISGLGKTLRKYRLDEWPQLWNVLRGDMSLVGPRPMKPEHGQLVQPMALARLLSVKPGLTGPDALAFIAEDDCLTGHSAPATLYAQYLLPEKIRCQLAYIDQRSFWLDLGWLYRSLRDVFAPTTYQRSLQNLTRLLPTGRSRIQSSRAPIMPDE